MDSRIFITVLLPFFATIAKAPCPADGAKCSSEKRSVIWLSSFIRLSPASATIIASNSPLFIFRILVSTLPLMGLASWFAGYPFMERHSASYLKKHPEKKGQDLETTKRLCKRIAKQPFTVTSFLEGTRFTAEKKQRQGSPYKYLLKPKEYYLLQTFFYLQSF